VRQTRKLGLRKFSRVSPYINLISGFWVVLVGEHGGNAQKDPVH